MSVYKSFAVVGGGMIGLPIVIALASRNVSVVLLSRPGSSQKQVPSGVEIVTVDFIDSAAVAAVFKAHNIDVVVSTITTQAVGAQKSLVDAAKHSGVKLFAPSEYGMPTDGPSPGFLGEKTSLAEYLKSVEIPSARFYVGIFTEIIPWLVGFSEHGKFRIVGKGEVPISWTSVPDIAGFVAYVLTALPTSELENRIFRIEGDRLSMTEVGTLFNTVVEHVENIESEESKAGLMKIMDTGAGSTGWDVVEKVEGTGKKAAGSDNALWPGHHWQTVKEVHGL
ncbi:hypothetical protein C8R43DRAFT_1002933 [Mycena crocata]|nr:hypothetical protein C8R43DRAFT_1002933 [Mycena crocata]